MPGAAEEPAVGTQQEEEITATALVAFLNVEYSRLETANEEIQFYWAEWENPPGRYDVEAWGEIVPSTYLAWLLMDQDARMDAIKQMAQALDEFCPGQTFGVILFYQDYWSIYPRSFRPDEVVLSVDGRSWLVTHVIGWAYGDQETVRYLAQP